MKNRLQIIPTDLLPTYLEQIPTKLQLNFDALKEAEISTDTFSFYTSVSAMASSKIEGESMEVDSYIKYKMLNIESLQDLVEKPNDLYNAYLFAQKNELNEQNFLEAHKILSAHLLESNKRGVCRTGNMVVMEHNTYRIQYEAAMGDKVKSLFAKLWKDIEQLKNEKLSIEETFFYASFIHLVFVNIHPFEDGNGRAGRLLEKWFLAQLLGEKAWYLQSELYYYQNINNYYKNLNKLGIFYDQLNYAEALPFLLMLPKALFIVQK
ncbi:MAG: Fic family protein [Crocinitomicaceae bacterium]|nr:Fic family protein [Crocinitomicaceae bacterium]